MPSPPHSSHAIIRAMLALMLLPMAAEAQDVSATPAETPPSVVGWLAQSSGTVWLSPGSGQAWQAALANAPLSSGEAIATAADGHATIEVMAMRAALAPASELALDQIGAEGLSATATSGELALDLSGLPQGASVNVTTPRGTVEIATPGRYGISAGGAGTPTLVTALGGTASIVNGGAAEEVGSGQTATLSTQSDGTIAVAISPAEVDPLLGSLIASAARPSPVAPPPVVAAMTGGANLASYGTWSAVPTYGTVWYPNVAAGWVPYRSGRWIYAAPWGWTWVDADPWGFAPFHYGRWVQIGPRWGWVPVAPGVQLSVGVPVYAPALVHFFVAGSIAGVGVSLSAGALAAGLVGWVPLGPGEFYRPPYAVSPAYMRQVNVYNVRNINRIDVTRINNNITINNFRNHAAITTVPASVLSDGRPVGPAFTHPAPASLAALRPLNANLPVRPAARPVWAEPPHGATAPPPLRRPAAPRPAAFRPAPGVPPTRPAEPPRPASAPHPVAQSRPAPAVEHPPPPPAHPSAPPRPAEPPHPAAERPPPPAHPSAPPRPAEPPHPVAERPPPPPHPAAPPRPTEPPHPVAERPPPPPHPAAPPRPAEPPHPAAERPPPPPHPAAPLRPTEPPHPVAERPPPPPHPAAPPRPAEPPHPVAERPPPPPHPAAPPRPTEPHRPTGQGPQPN